MKSVKGKVILALTIVIVLCASIALANPSGGTAVYGNATVTTPNSNTVQVNISGNKAIINWNSFSIANGEITQFVFANTGSGNFSNAVLNRVTSGNASTIAGQIQSNGAVFLVNPNGIIFSGTARINTPAFFASTLGISNDQFKAFTPTQTNTDHWQMVFSAVPGTAGNIELQNGAQIITNGQDGVIALMAKSIKVAQGVTLSAPNGTVMLVAAKEMTLSQSGYGNYGMFNMAYNTETGNNIANSGTIDIRDGSGQGGGTVNIVGDHITQSGTIYAVTADQKVSRVLLVASGDVNVTSGAVIDSSSGGTNRAGYIGIAAGGMASIANGVTITAQGNANSGGDVIIKGNGLSIGQNASINVSGNNGNSGTVTATLNGGGDLYANIEYARLAVRPDGNKMVLENDGTLNLPPVLPPQIKEQAESRLSATMKAPTITPVNNMQPGLSPNVSKSAEIRVQSAAQQNSGANTGTAGSSTQASESQEK